MQRSNTRIAITGAAGRMGRALIGLNHMRAKLSLVAALEQPGSPHLGADPGLLAGTDATGIEIVDDLKSVIDQFDVLIDFTVPESTLNNVDICRSAGKRMVIGTTGLGDSVRDHRRSARRDRNIRR